MIIPQVKINTFDTPERIDAFAAQVDGVALFTDIGNTARALIEMRTLAGDDVEGNPFVGYSTRPMYASTAKRPAGYPLPAGGELTDSGKSMYFPGGYRQYKAGIGRGGTPNLSLSNQMLGDMQMRAEEERAVIDFSTAESAAKAHGHHFGTVVPQRQFFGIQSNQDLGALEDELAGYVADAAARANVPLSGGH